MPNTTYLVHGSDLASVANAIRTKGGTSAQLEFPDEFVEAIGDISTGITPTGTKNINTNGTHDVTNYASAQVAVPNSYAAGDEGKVVSNGALVAQGSDTVTQNDTYDTTLISSLTVNVSGGGGGIDLSDIAVPISQNSLGGLFQAMKDGTWDSIELTVTSGTNPIVINFGRPIKGFIAYPKNITVVSGLANNENDAFTLDVFTDPDENLSQSANYFVTREKRSNTSVNLFSRVASYTFVNGVLSIVPSYPSNAGYHPFAFNKPYIFVYWWEETA